MLLFGALVGSLSIGGDMMMSKGRALILAVMVGCADGSSGEAAADAPDWWRFAADVGSPIGGDWQASNGACLYVWHDRIQWDNEVIMCDVFANGDGHTCLVNLEGYTIEPIEDGAGYLGAVVLTLPDGRTRDMEPRCLE